MENSRGGLARRCHFVPRFLSPRSGTGEQSSSQGGRNSKGGGDPPSNSDRLPRIRFQKDRLRGVFVLESFERGDGLADRVADGFSLLGELLPHVIVLILFEAVGDFFQFGNRRLRGGAVF